MVDSVDKDVQVRTLHLNNLPKRPESKDHYIGLLLRHINPSNPYLRTENSVTHNLNSLNDLTPLDKENGILEISVSNKRALQRQCFITFEDHQKAQQFKIKNSKLKINGRTVKIDYARKDSLLALSLRGKGILNKVVKLRNKKKELNNNKSLLEQMHLKRKLRRLRATLRKRELGADEIKETSDKFIKEFQKKSPSKLSNSKKEQQDLKTKEKIKKINDAIHLNPPNNILLVQNLPPNVDFDELKILFNNDNLKEVRLVSVRQLAFVEYTDIQSATTVKDRLGFQYNWKNSLLSIAFAK